MNAKEIITYANIFNKMAVENMDDKRVWRCIEQMDIAKQLLEKELEKIHGELRRNER